MATRLSKFFQQRRLERGLRLSDLARLCGYLNISRGCNRIKNFEGCGGIDARLFAKLATALKIDESTIARLAEQDREEYLRNWNEWADQYQTPHVCVRAIPGVIISVQLPPEAETQEEMEAFVADIAERQRKKVWLVLSRRLTILFDESASVRKVIHAKPGSSNCPYMRLKGSRKKFVFTSEVGGLGVRPIVEPEHHDPTEEPS